jgi:hypothetical protein
LVQKRRTTTDDLATARPLLAARGSAKIERIKRQLVLLLIMIKRTTKMKTNTSRPTITKAAPIKTQAAKVEPTKNQTAKPAQVRADFPKARLELVKPEAKSVCVAGSFNDWNPAKTPLARTEDGKWVGELTGISGRHEYLFVVDGQWLPDPNAQESVQNPFGGRNSVLVASA